jgi:hypothetical protein
MLRALKLRVWEDSILNEYQKVCKGPAFSYDINQWLSQWNMAYHDAVRFNLAGL